MNPIWYWLAGFVAYAFALGYMRTLSDQRLNELRQTTALLREIRQELTEIYQVQCQIAAGKN